FSKIIPDGLLTAGSHVQYFFRKSLITPHTGITFAMAPDTGVITPQLDEGNTDQHRWSTFAILPDRWKDSAFSGPGNACMLYIDWNDRRGNEGRFVSVMDSIGGTQAKKFSAHNGWHAKPTDDITDPAVVPTVSTYLNSQPGGTWDMFQVKASESLT